MQRTRILQPTKIYQISETQQMEQMKEWRQNFPQCPSTMTSPRCCACRRALQRETVVGTYRETPERGEIDGIIAAISEELSKEQALCLTREFHVDALRAQHEYRASWRATRRSEAKPSARRKPSTDPTRQGVQGVEAIRSASHVAIGPCGPMEEVGRDVRRA